ncbi:MAG: hypothetical protein H6839_03145 [Planctomycetes bacterium]|nr:hypothetical protein [Planctomycetota bacterium]
MFTLVGGPIGPAGILVIAFSAFVAGAIAASLVAAYVWQARTTAGREKLERYRDRIRSRFQRKGTEH